MREFLRLLFGITEQKVGEKRIEVERPDNKDKPDPKATRDKKEKQLNADQNADLDDIKTYKRLLEYQKALYAGTLRTFELRVKILAQKVDLLTDALGIVIVEDCVSANPVAHIASIRSDDLLKGAQEYMRAAVAADQMMQAHSKMIKTASTAQQIMSREISDALKKIEWRKQTRAGDERR